jgi:hypothetical protein
MKQIVLFLVSIILLSACSLAQFIPGAGSTPTLAATSTTIPTNAPTFTPITPTLTFTTTPTLVGIKTTTPTPEFTFTPDAVTPLFLITPNTATPTFQMEGFLSVSISETEFYKGSQCTPTSVKFVAQVNDNVKSTIVDLFVRFKSKRTGATGEWTRITMQSIGAGTFTHDLVPEELKGLASFQNAWVQYQFVANTSRSREVGRTAIFGESLTLLDCNPTPTPSPIPTPTVLKP